MVMKMSAGWTATLTSPQAPTASLKNVVAAEPDGTTINRYIYVTGLPESDIQFGNTIQVSAYTVLP